MRIACRLWKLFPDNIQEFRQQDQTLMEAWSIFREMQDQPRIWVCKTIFTKESWRETMFRITFTSTSEATELANTEINILFAIKSFSCPFFLSMYIYYVWWYLLLQSIFFSADISTCHVSFTALHYRRQKRDCRKLLAIFRWLNWNLDRTELGVDLRMKILTSWAPVGVKKHSYIFIPLYVYDLLQQKYK